VPDGDPILVRRGEGPWKAPEITGFANEAELQHLLGEYPQLLPHVADGAEVCREFESGVGPADLVIVNPDGSLVVVECKLASNRQVRREVVGQVLDYSSRLWQMPIAEFEARWRGVTGHALFEDVDQQEADPRERLQASLDSGEFTLLLAVDGINDDLRRIVEYLNHVTRAETAILAFELARVADGDVQFLMPRIYGRELVEAKQRGSSTRQGPWSIEDVLTWMRENRPELVPVTQSFLDGIEATWWHVWAGTARTPSLIIGRPPGGPKILPFSLFTTPRQVLEVRLYEIVALVPELGDFVRDLQAVDSTIDPQAIHAAGYRRMPRIELDALADPQALSRLLGAMERLAARLPAPTDGSG
jgi:hypothetical protein